MRCSQSWSFHNLRSEVERDGQGQESPPGSRLVLIRQPDGSEDVPRGRVAERERRQDGHQVEDVLGDGGRMCAALQLASEQQDQLRVEQRQLGFTFLAKQWMTIC